MGETSEPLCPLREDMSGEMPPCNQGCALLMDSHGELMCSLAVMAAKDTDCRVVNRRKVDL